MQQTLRHKDRHARSWLIEGKRREDYFCWRNQALGLVRLNIIVQLQVIKLSSPHPFYELTQTPSRSILRGLLCTTPGGACHSQRWSWQYRDTTPISSLVLHLFLYRMKDKIDDSLHHSVDIRFNSNHQTGRNVILSHNAHLVSVGRKNPLYSDTSTTWVSMAPSLEENVVETNKMRERVRWHGKHLLPQPHLHTFLFFMTVLHFASGNHIFQLDNIWPVKAPHSPWPKNEWATQFRLIRWSLP